MVKDILQNSKFPQIDRQDYRVATNVENRMRDDNSTHFLARLVLKASYISPQHMTIGSTDASRLPLQRSCYLVA